MISLIHYYSLISLYILIVLSHYAVISLSPERSNVIPKIPASQARLPGCTIEGILSNSFPLDQSQKHKSPAFPPLTNTLSSFRAIAFTMS